ncbi:DUF4158 domain-containing protein [Streptomyces sp. NPDC059118]|uniref:DUF4158 domain-containing protein n=1 Tax=unclassified Streptomyces TaxID=2593676 RepID=UPI0036A8A76B
MRQQWSPEESPASWTLMDGDWKLVANKTGPTRLGFCLMSKFFEIEARFPEFIEEFPQPAVEYVAGLVKVPTAELAKYDLPGAKRHRKQIREALVDLLIALVHKINARAERRVEKQLTAEPRKVRGKEGILFKLAEAAVGKPDEVVRRALYPVVGQKTLRDLVAEAKANEKVFNAKVRTTLRSSYGSYYRQILPPLLNTLGFQCNNSAYQPVMDAMKLLKKYADVDGKTRFYDADDAVPMDGVVRKGWREAVVDDKSRVERIPYELCVLVALRDAVRRREIYVEGAAR